MLRLEVIHERHRRAYLEAAKEFFDQPEPDADFFYELAHDDFTEVVRRYHNRARGIDLPPAYAQEYKYLLMDGDVVVGRGGIRPEPNDEHMRSHGHIGYVIRPSCRNRGYGTAALTLLLRRSAELGIREPIIVCKPDNHASLNIIKKMGGAFLDTVTLPDGSTRTRYHMPESKP
ncbi:MAG: GNAT family N-acetyltransferase [Patescibacteria group bacterium]